MPIICAQIDREGQLWEYNPDSGVAAVNITPYEFASSFKQGTHIRLMGTPENAPLIIELYNKQHHVELVSPLMGGSCAQRQKVSVALPNIYLCDVPPLLGGPHIMTDKDIYSYMLAAGHTIEHPLWAKLRWIRCLSKSVCHELLGIIIDPRWYVDLHNPNRLSKLTKYLRLSPYDVQRSILYHTPNPAINCWFNSTVANQVTQHYKTYSNIIDTDAGVFGLAPEDWVWRMWWTLTSFGRHTTVLYNTPASQDVFAKAVLKTSQRLIRFIYFLWMEWLYSSHRDWQFRPEDFLRYKLEIDSFNEHCGVTTCQNN